MGKKEEDFEKAFQEMVEKIKELPPDFVNQLNENLDKMKKEADNEK